MDSVIHPADSPFCVDCNPWKNLWVVGFLSKFVNNNGPRNHRDDYAFSHNACASHGSQGEGVGACRRGDYSREGDRFGGGIHNNTESRNNAGNGDSWCIFPRIPETHHGVTGGQCLSGSPHAMFDKGRNTGA